MYVCVFVCATTCARVCVRMFACVYVYGCVIESLLLRRFIYHHISVDSLSDETLNRGPLALLLQRQFEFPFGIYIVQFPIFQFQLLCVPVLTP